MELNHQRYPEGPTVDCQQTSRTQGNSRLGLVDLLVVARSRMRGAIPPPQYIFIVWCLVRLVSLLVIKHCKKHTRLKVHEGVTEMETATNPDGYSDKVYGLYFIAHCLVLCTSDVPRFLPSPNSCI